MIHQSMSTCKIIPLMREILFRSVLSNQMTRLEAAKPEVATLAAVRCVGSGHQMRAGVALFCKPCSNLIWASLWFTSSRDLVKLRADCSFLTALWISVLLTVGCRLSTAKQFKRRSTNQIALNNLNLTKLRPWLNESCVRLAIFSKINI